MKPISHLVIAGLLLSLAGCGLEVAGTAATGASIKKQELEQGQKTMRRAEHQINQFNQQAVGRLENMDVDNLNLDQEQDDED